MNNRQIKSQAHRKLRHLQNYVSLAENNLPSAFKDISLEYNEELVGVYKNVIDGFKDAILLTSKAIYVNMDQSNIVYLPLDQISGFESPMGNEKYSVDSIKLYLNSDEEIIIPIRGGKGNLRDVWAFVSFFRQIIKPSPRRDENLG